MDKTKALQKLLNGTATKKEIETLRQALASGEISVGGNVEGKLVIIGSGNTVEITPEKLGIIQPEPKTEEPAAGEPPYMGLRYFDTSDTDLFYGREVLTRELLARVQKESFLAIVGASGSGKSSVARAGLIPAWKQENKRGAVRVITPTAHPLESLASSLTRESESVTATSTLMDDLEKDIRSLRLYVRKTLGETKLLLLVDQFEETFTLCKDGAERKAFIENLLSLADDDSARVVITLRADFYHHCAEYEGLRHALKTHQEYIGAMTTDELRQAITTPAHANGWDFQPGLVDLILSDVGAEPGALPLLSHALLETWKRRLGRTLTLQGYHEAGGVKKAIAQTAESVYDKLTPAEQTIARSIFLRLTELGEGTQDTRRRVKLDELAQSKEWETAGKVLKILTDARLVTTEKDNAEVAHEALIREWETLRKWLNEDRENLRVHRQLTESAREWEGSGKSELYLIHRGVRLDNALWIAKNAIYELTFAELEYLNACVAYQKQEQNRRERLRKQSVIGIGLGFIFVSAFAIFAVFQWYSAVKQAEITMARQITTQAQSVYLFPDSTKQTIAILLAIQSMKIFPSLDASEILQNTILPSSLSTMTREKIVYSVDLSPNGDYIVSGGCDQVDKGVCVDGSARVWNVITGEEIARMSYGGAVNSVAFSPNGEYIVSSGCDHVEHSNCSKGSVRVWEAVTGHEIARMKLDGIVDSAAFSPDGIYVVFRVKYRILYLWDPMTGQEIARISHNGFVFSIAFSPNGKYIVSGCSDNIARVWEVATGYEISHAIHEDAVNSVAFSPDAKYIVSGSSDNTARVWEAINGQETFRMTHDGIVTSVAFSPDGKYISSGSSDNTARVWDAFNGKEISRISYEGSVSAVAFSPDSRYVISAGCDQVEILRCINGSTRIWDATTGYEIARMSHNNWVNSISFSRRYAASGSDDGTVQIRMYSPEELISFACTHVTRNLTREEWNKYIGDMLSYRAICDNLPVDIEYVKPIAVGALLNLKDPDRVKTALEEVEAELKKDDAVKDPAIESLRIVGEVTGTIIVDKANFGDIEEAFDLYGQALKIQLQISNEKKEAFLMAISDGVIQISKEDIVSALVVIKKAEEMQLFIKDANALNSVCWYGSLQEYAEHVLQYCELAVVLKPDDAGIRDSRGLARALTGDYQGAVSDFQYFVDNFSCFSIFENVCFGDGDVEIRQQWIEQLKNGINPFTPEILESLRQ